MMPALRLAGSLLGTLCFTLVFCLMAPLMSEKQGAVLPELISPVQLVPLAAPLERQKQIRILPKKMRQLSKSSQKKIPKREKIDPIQIQMNPLKMEEAPFMAATMPRPVAPKTFKATAIKTAPGATGIYDMAVVDSPPRLKHYIPPMYPPKAKGQRIEGKVFVRCAVSAGGKVLNAWIIQADPVGYFEKAALKSVKKWTFVPAEFQGKKVAVHVEIPLSFSLD